MSWLGFAMDVPETIICVDCGGTAHFLQLYEGEPPEADVAAYRCEDCHDRWDIELEDV